MLILVAKFLPAGNFARLQLLLVFMAIYWLITHPWVFEMMIRRIDHEMIHKYHNYANRNYRYVSEHHNTASAAVSATVDRAETATMKLDEL